MDTPDTRRLPINPQLQPVSLSTFADDAAALAAQQGLGDPTDATHTFQPLQTSIENLEQHQQPSQHHLQDANPTETPAFLRPPRPGESANYLLITPHHTPTQQYQQIKNTDNCDNARLDQLGLRVSSITPQLQQQNEPNFALTADMAIKQADHRRDLKLDPNPPDLDAWREKLFNVDEAITLSEEQYVILAPSE